MELRLKYNNELHQPVAAAFLNGSNINDWLKQISLWHIAANELSCYIIPQSVNSVKAAGLFVIFNNAVNAKNIDLLHPYTCIGKRLYIPCNAALIPAITTKDLDKLLLWDLQVFHPVIGLIGFEEKNQIQFTDLFIYPQAKKMDWGFAHPGLADRPALHQIIVKPVSAETIIEEIKADIGQKPIEEILSPEERGDSFFDKVFTGLKIISFLPILGLIKLVELLPQGGGVSNSANSSGGKPGLLKQLQNWFEKNLDELQKKRENEIKRLLNLFDDNTNEALQYAIPLNSPYLNRGESETPSSVLGRRSTNFNLRNLGGGRGVDSWDVSNYYSDLRTKYLNAAQKEIEKKDFKKAAYVYAYLLGDYYNAAAVLERGNFFREAAALHKDHLKNKPAAAQCLERGGLYSEAIDLYKELKEDEKVGDLYMQISQEDNAQQHYEHCVEIKINNDDMLDAARVLNEKMMLEERAKEILLQGWKGDYQHEPCLKKYFDIVIKKESTGIENTVQEIYKNHTSERKELPFLNILEYVNKKTNDEIVLNTSQEIAYEILHKEAVKGNKQSLHNLKKFLPGNKLIAADTSRFVSSNTSRIPQDAMPAFIQLDNSILWKKTTGYRNQFIAAGIKNNRLHVARVNWYGNTEYYSWDNEVKDYISVNFISNPYYSNEIIIHSSSDIPFARRVLPKDKYFNERLVICCPIWLHKGTPQFLIDKESQIVKLDINNGDMTLHHYTTQGVLRKSVNCIFEDKSVSLSAVLSNPALYFNDEFYYSYTGSHFLIISATGQSKATNLFTGIRIFCALEYSTDFFIVISTNKGCTLCKPDKGELLFTGEYFAESLIPLSITFIETHKFVIAEKMKATVFEITDGKPVIIHQVETSTILAGILPGTKRNAFATLEENGKVIIHSFPGN